MNAQTILPKRLVNYIHDTGVKALDNLAEKVQPAADGQPSALQTLVGHWTSMSQPEKEQFVDRVAASVIEVIAATSLLPVGARLGKKAVKSARKAIKRQKKALKKSAAASKKAKKKSKSTKAA